MFLRSNLIVFSKSVSRNGRMELMILMSWVDWLIWIYRLERLFRVVVRMILESQKVLMRRLLSEIKRAYYRRILDWLIWRISLPEITIKPNRVKTYNRRNQVYYYRILRKRFIRNSLRFLIVSKRILNMDPNSKTKSSLIVVLSMIINCLYQSLST